MRAPLVLSYVFLCFSYNCIGRYQQIQTNEEKIITFSNFEFFIDLSVGLISFGGHPPELPKPSRTLGKAQNLSFRTRNVTKIIENKSLYSLFIPFGGGPPRADGELWSPINARWPCAARLAASRPGLFDGVLRVQRWSGTSGRDGAGHPGAHFAC